MLTPRPGVHCLVRIERGHSLVVITDALLLIVGVGEKDAIGGESWLYCRWMGGIGIAEAQAEHSEYPGRQIQQSTDFFGMITKSPDVARAETRRLGSADHALSGQGRVDASHGEEFGVIQIGSGFVGELGEAIVIRQEGEEQRCVLNLPLISAECVDLIPRLTVSYFNG